MVMEPEVPQGGDVPPSALQDPSPADVLDSLFFLSEHGWQAARCRGVFDAIIVGTGPCGLAVAARLLQRDPHARVLMLERGPFFLPVHAQSLAPALCQSLHDSVSETFPWALAGATARGADGRVTYTRGMRPAVGGRSTMWAAWSPRPAAAEMHAWPPAVAEAARRYFPPAERFLGVTPVDQLAPPRAAAAHPVYGALQRRLQQRLSGCLDAVRTLARAEPAPLAFCAPGDPEFGKWAAPGPLLQLIDRQRALATAGRGAPLSVAVSCDVRRIVATQAGTAIALHTSRGELAVRGAAVVLAMGTLPVTTLVQNSFPRLRNVGTQFCAHIISAIVARVPRAALDNVREFAPSEVAACFVSGAAEGDPSRQFHLQLTALCETRPEASAADALRYVPDMFASASEAQLVSSKEHVVFICAAVGELGSLESSSFLPCGTSSSRGDHNCGEKSIISRLHLVSNDATTLSTWEAMDRAAFSFLEELTRFSEGDNDDCLEYWHGDTSKGEWRKGERPTQDQIRVPFSVHESSTLQIGDDDTNAPVDLQYRLAGTENVYVTGGCLWPRAGSWNPTLTMVSLAMHLADTLSLEKKLGKSDL